MTRDPRANYYSGIKHHKKYNPESMNGAHHYFYLTRIIEDINPLIKLPNDYVSIKLEDLGEINILKKISDWLSIDYNVSMMESTWAGLIWNADRLSINERTGTGFCGNLIKNNWENHLTWKDKYVLNFLMVDRLKHYGYDYFSRSILSYIIMPFLIILPMSLERNWFRIFDNNSKNIKIVLGNIYYYSKRCFYFFVIYIKIIVYKNYSGKLINHT